MVVFDIQKNKEIFSENMLQMNLHKRKFEQFLSIYILVIALFLIACSKDSKDLREPTSREIFFIMVAEDFNAPQLCEKVSPKAYLAASFAVPKGYQASYSKSDCYYAIAVKTKNKNLCNNVKTLSIPFADGSKISKEYCIKDIENNREWNIIPILPSKEDLAKFMNELDYNYEILLENQYKDAPLSSPIYEIYNKLKNQEAFLAKVDSLPDYNEPFSESKIREANNYELLYQMLAIDNNEYAFCEKISPNAYFKHVNVVQPNSLRSYCFYTIATNTKNLQICEKVLPKDSTPLGNKYLHKEECKESVNNKLQPSYSDDGLRYGFIDYTSVEDFINVFTDLGYQNIYDSMINSEYSPRYFDYYLEIKFSYNTTEKDNFVNKVEAMPV